MTYAKLRTILLIFINIFFILSIILLYVSVTDTVKKHIVTHIKKDIHTLSHTISSYIDNNILESSIGAIENAVELNSMINNISILDRDKRVILSTMNEDIGKIYSKEIVEISKLNRTNHDTNVGFFTTITVDLKDDPLIYFVTAEISASELNSEILDKFLLYLFVLAISIVILFLVINFISIRYISAPIKEMISYTKNRDIIMNDFYLKDLDYLKNAILEYSRSLESQKNYLQNILDTQDDLIITTKDYKIRSVNRSFLTFFEVENLQEFKEKCGNLCDLFDKENSYGYLFGYKSDEEWIEDIFKKEIYKSQRAKIQITSKDGVQIFEIKINKIEATPENRHMLILSNITEITDYQEKLEKMVRRELKRRKDSEKRYENIFNSSNYGICIHGFDDNRKPDKFIEVNKKMEKIFGYTKDELAYLTPKDLRGVVESIDVESIEKEIFENKEAHFQESLRRKDGVMILCDLTTHILPLEGKEVAYTSIRDITHEKKREEEAKKREELLIQQSKMSSMGEMLGSITHQWKQPLNAVAALVGVIEDYFENKDDIPKEELDDYFQKITQQIGFLSSTIDDFRNFFKPSKIKKEFFVEKSIVELYEMLKNQYISHGLKVKITKKEGVNDRAFGYSNEFKHVIMNLLNNSKDAILQRRNLEKYKGIVNNEIEIFIDGEEGEVVVHFRDSAGGFENKIVKNLFRQYNTSKGDKGTGIGLYISKMIIENMDGSIDGKNYKNGVEFIIKVPKRS